MNNMHYTADLAGSIQRGEKTQTRRIDKRLPSGDVEVTTQFDEQGRCFVFFNGKCFPLKYRLGEVLWIREPAKVVLLDKKSNIFCAKYLSDEVVETFFIEDKYPNGIYPKWMEKLQGIPNGCIREMARTFIRITNIRVERLDEIEYDDVLAEGFPLDSYEMKQTDKLYSADMHGEVDFEEDRAFEWFTSLWVSMNGVGSVDNRWVPVYEFELISKEEAIS